MALFTCLGRHMGALPLGPDEAFRALQAKRLKSLPNGALAAPSQVRVVISYRSNGDSYPICGDRPVPDVPAGQILPSELGGPRRRKWGAIDSDFLTEGEGGARLAIARLGRVPSWPGTGHEASQGGSSGMEPHPSWDPNETDKSTVTRSRMFLHHLNAS